MVIDLLELSNINANIDTSVFNSSSQEQVLLKEDKIFNKIIEEELIQRLNHQKTQPRTVGLFEATDRSI